MMTGVPPRPEVTQLFEQILSSGNDLVVRVTGGSMAPALRSGDTVVLRRVPPEEVRPGDIAFFRDASGRPILHRVIRRWVSPDGTRSFQTIGDALCTPEPPFSGEALLGIAVALRRPGSGGTETEISLMTTGARIRARTIALLARAGFRRFRRTGGGPIPACRS